MDAENRARTAATDATHRRATHLELGLPVHARHRLETRHQHSMAGKRQPVSQLARAGDAGTRGIPVDRKNPQHVVDEVVALIRSGENFSLVVTPDGTRKGHSHWKSGFYRIARETGMPVVLGYVDRTTKTTGLGTTLELTGNVAKDMDRIRAFYADKSGFHPEHRVERRLRDETGTADNAETGTADNAETAGPETSDPQQ